MIEIPSNVRGLIFDCDGTIADTMPLHYQAWTTALGEHKVEFSEALFYELGGMPTTAIIELLNARHNHTMPVHETAHRKEVLFEQLIPQTKPIQPVIDMIDYYHGKMPLAVATGGFRRICEKTLSAMNILDRFITLVCAEDVTHGKPAPDIYLEAARRINVHPTLCAAFEDANLGVQSAQAAGMYVVDVRHFIHRQEK
jgi:beta-phosphoglucomutase family hydrolase